MAKETKYKKEKDEIFEFAKEKSKSRKPGEEYFIQQEVLRHLKTLPIFNKTKLPTRNTIKNILQEMVDANTLISEEKSGRGYKYKFNEDFLFQITQAKSKIIPIILNLLETNKISDFNVRDGIPVGINYDNNTVVEYQDLVYEELQNKFDINESIEDLKKVFEEIETNLDYILLENNVCNFCLQRIKDKDALLEIEILIEREEVPSIFDIEQEYYLSEEAQPSDWGFDEFVGQYYINDKKTRRGYLKQYKDYEQEKNLSEFFDISNPPNLSTLTFFTTENDEIFVKEREVREFYLNSEFPSQGSNNDIFWFTGIYANKRIKGIRHLKCRSLVHTQLRSVDQFVDYHFDIIADFVKNYVQRPLVYCLICDIPIDPIYYLNNKSELKELIEIIDPKLSYQLYKDLHVNIIKERINTFDFGEPIQIDKFDEDFNELFDPIYDARVEIKRGINSFVNVKFNSQHDQYYRRFSHVWCKEVI